MRLTDALETAARSTPPKRVVPTGFEPGIRYVSGTPAEVTLALREVPENEAAWREAIKNATTLDIPAEQAVDLTDVRYWGDPGNPMVYARFKIRPAVTGTLDLDEMVRAARRQARSTVPKTTNAKTFVAVLADAQVGKTGSRGGTTELLERFEKVRAGIDDRARRLRCEDAVLLEAGDCIESVENTASQAHTNDLSVPEQLRVSRRMLLELTITMAKRHNALRVATVPSNHGAWRKGKNTLGRPRDDYGIENLIAVADALALSEKYDHVSCVIPEKFGKKR